MIFISEFASLSKVKILKESPALRANDCSPILVVSDSI